MLRFVLISKDQGEVGSRKFCLICLLESMGKLYKHLIRACPFLDLEEKDGFLNGQYEFRSGGLAMDVAENVVKLTTFANSGTWRRKNHCILTVLGE